MLPRSAVEPLPLFVQSWFANCILCYFEYFLSGGLWALWVYKCASARAVTRELRARGAARLSPRCLVVRRLHCTHAAVTGYPNKQLVGRHPSAVSMRAQALVSCKAIPLYTLLPPLSEHLILSGWTKCYGRLAGVSPLLYCAQVALYMLSVEFGVYWQHRKLHEIKWLYTALHRIHHVYNKDHTLSPFAGLAFHPIDGLLQAVPYVWTLFLTPMHYFTHEVLLFLTGVWTANIHDCIHGECEPIMGAAYHTIHHITYKHNYGHYTTLFDRMFGTLERPKAVAKAKAATAKAD